MSRSDTRPSFDRSCVTPSSSPARTRMARSNARGSSLPRSISNAPSAFSQELTSSAIVSIVSPLRRYGISSTQIEGAVEPDTPSRDAQVRSESQRVLQSNRTSRSTPGKAPQQAADRRIEQSRRQPLPADPCSDRAEKLAIAGAQALTASHKAVAARKKPKAQETQQRTRKLTDHFPVIDQRHLLPPAANGSVSRSGSRRCLWSITARVSSVHPNTAPTQTNGPGNTTMHQTAITSAAVSAAGQRISIRASQ